MKALVCLAAVCLIVWCAADIAIKLEQAQMLARQEKLLTSIAHSVCSHSLAC
jgi:hypothetical protein